MSPSRRTILVVEDESSLRRNLCRMLELSGYAVLCAASSLEAIQLSADQETQVDLLLTDATLSGVSGYQLAGVLLRLRPKLQVIVISGHAESELPDAQALGRPIPLLQKPFPSEQLLELIRELLAPPSGARDQAG